MAVKKKVKAKAKSKRIAKPARKPARKRAVRPAAKPKPASPPERALPGERIGVVTHYYANPMVAIVKLETATLRVGDSIHIRGHTSDFSQRVESLQVEHAAVNEVGPNDDFGIKVVQHAREHDVVYKLPAS